MAWTNKQYEGPVLYLDVVTRCGSVSCCGAQHWGRMLCCDVSHSRLPCLFGFFFVRRLLILQVFCYSWSPLIPQYSEGTCSWQTSVDNLFAWGQSEVLHFRYFFSPTRIDFCVCSRLFSGLYFICLLLCFNRDGEEKAVANNANGEWPPAMK